MQPIHFLLVGARGNAWRQILETAIAPLGRLEVAEEDDLDDIIQQRVYAFVIVDATYVQDVIPIIRTIRHHHRETRVLVVTASPSWKRARDVLKAGAVDYVKKSVDAAKVQQLIADALTKGQPVWIE